MVCGSRRLPRHRREVRRGIPGYGKPGPAKGYELIDGYRTRLKSPTTGEHGR
jgi:hypothetical protein